MEIENSPSQAWKLSMQGARIGKGDIIYVWQKKFTIELESPNIPISDAHVQYYVPNSSPKELPLETPSDFKIQFVVDFQYKKGDAPHKITIAVFCYLYKVNLERRFRIYSNKSQVKEKYPTVDRLQIFPVSIEMCLKVNEQAVSIGNNWNTSNVNSNSNTFLMEQELLSKLTNVNTMEEPFVHKQLENKNEVMSIYKTVAPQSIQLRELTEIEIKFLSELLEQGRLLSWLIEAMKTIEKIASFFVSKPRLIAGFISEEDAIYLLQRSSLFVNRPFILRFGDKDPSKLILHFSSQQGEINKCLLMSPSELSVASVGRKLWESTRCQNLVDVDGQTYNKTEHPLRSILALSGKDDDYLTYEETNQ